MKSTLSVLLVTEPAKAECIQVHFQGSIGSDECIDSQIKFSASNEQWIIDITGNNIGFFKRECFQWITVGSYAGE